MGGERVDRTEGLLYGRMYLPRGVLEGLWMRRVGETGVGVVKGVSGGGRGGGGTVGISSHERFNYSLYSVRLGLGSWADMR